MNRNDIQRKTSIKLALERYQKLNEGLKKKSVSPSLIPTLGKVGLVMGLPLIAVEVVDAQCTGAVVNSVYLPNDGGPGNGFDLDVDGGGADFRFFEGVNNNGKILALGTMGIVRTNGPYTTFSAYRFTGGQTIPGGLPTATIAYFDFPGGGQWGANGTTGFIGIRSAAGDYGFIEFTLVERPSGINGQRYIVSFPGLAGISSPGTGSVVAGDCGSLPVELTTFVAQAKGQDATLIWKTATETNNAGFEIQRSEDGKKFNKISWQDGHGTSLEAHSYEFIETQKTTSFGGGHVLISFA